MEIQNASVLDAQYSIPAQNEDLWKSNEYSYMKG